MLINEVKKEIENKKKEELKSIICGMYKAIPKKMREEKMIDDIVRGTYQREKAKAAPLPRPRELENEIDSFLTNAYKGLYYRRNRTVSDKARRSWRSTIKGYLKALRAVGPEDEEYNLAINLFAELLALLGYADTYHTFATTQPFEAIGENDEAMLEEITKKKLDSDKSSDALIDLFNLVNRTFYPLDTYHKPNPLFLILARLITPDERKTEALNLLESYFSNHSLIYRRCILSIENEETYIKDNEDYMCELAFTIYATMGKYEEGLSFLKAHYPESWKHSYFREALMLLAYYRQKELFLREYHQWEKAAAENTGVNQLLFYRLDSIDEENYKSLKETGDFPEP